MKKLYKSSYNKKFDGVCGGIAEYLNVDATLIRLLWVIFAFMGSAGVWAYIICMLVIPRDPGVAASPDDTFFNQNQN